MKRLIGVGLAAGAVAGAWTVVISRHRPKSIDEQVLAGLNDHVAGWWVELVLREFDFLVDDFGYTLAKVFLHFKGNGVTFRGPVFEFKTDYDPEATHSIDAKLWLVADPARDGLKVGSGHPTVIDVNRLLLARDPTFPIPKTMPDRLDRAHVTDAVATWARGLRELAPDVLAGEWPEGIDDDRPG